MDNQNKSDSKKKLILLFILGLTIGFILFEIPRLF